MAKTINEIDEVKKKLSNGHAKIENGKTIVEVGLSDLNKLLDIAYTHIEKWEKVKEFITQKANANLISDKDWELYNEILHYMNQEEEEIEP